MKEIWKDIEGYENMYQISNLGNVMSFKRKNPKLLSKTINLDGVGMFASHYPATVFPGQYQVFGHLHTLKDDTSFFIKGKTSDVLKPTQYDVGVDQNDFRPISYWELCNIFKQR